MSFGTTKEYAEALLSNVAQLLKLRGHIQELEILINCEGDIHWGITDWGISYGTLYLKMQTPLYFEVVDYKDQYERNIADAVKHYAEPEKEELEVKIVPKVTVIPNWRESVHSLSASQFGLPLPHSQYKSDIFMLMPFTVQLLNEVYQHHVSKVATSLKLTIKRADDFFSKREIVKEIWSAINAAQIIVADCTGKNPNVFYEIGMAHSIGKPTIIITMNEEDVPYDLRHIRYIPYVSTPGGLISLEDKLGIAIKKIMSNDKDENNIVQTIVEGDDIPF